MAPSHLFDLSQHDLTQVKRDTDYIESINPHRGGMRLVDGVIWDSIIPGVEAKAIAYKDIGDDEFWCDGHIPGRPIFPGVLMIEAGAQLASYLTMHLFPDLKFMGFAAVDKVKFRGQVVPGDRLILLADGYNIKPRRSLCNVQGINNGKLVFEGTITGMPI